MIVWSRSLKVAHDCMPGCLEALTGLAISEISKSVPQLLPYHKTVPELTVKAL